MAVGVEHADHLVDQVGGKGESTVLEATDNGCVEAHDGGVDFWKSAPKLGFLVFSDGGIHVDGLIGAIGEGDEC